MPRVKKGKSAHKHRRHLLKHAKGFRWGRKNLFTKAKEALIKAGTYARRDRRAKKRDFRRLWQVKIGAAAKEDGISYSRLINKLKLGDKVDSADAADLPLDLAIAILEDSDGLIDLDLPIAGSLDDPQFSYGSIV